MPVLEDLAVQGRDRKELNMADESDTPSLRWILVMVLVVAAVSFIIVDLQLPPNEVKKTILGSLVDVVIGGVVVHGLLTFHRREIARRAGLAEIAGRVERLAAELRKATFLMSTHKSGKTWGEQIRALIPFHAQLKDDLSRLKGAEQHEVRDAVSHLSSMESDLRKLFEGDYRTQHEFVDRKQLDYERGKAAAIRAGTAPPDRESHWLQLLASLQCTNEFLSNSETLTSRLDKAARGLRRAAGQRAAPPP